MKDTLTILLSLTIIVVGFLVWQFSTVDPPETVGKLTSIECSFTGNATISSSTVSNTSSEVLERNVDRCYGALVNDGSNPVYLGLTNDSTGASSTVHEGIRLNANGGSIEFDNQMPYAGAVQAITQSGTSTLTITEY